MKRKRNVITAIVFIMFIALIVLIVAILIKITVGTGDKKGLGTVKVGTENVTKQDNSEERKDDETLTGGAEDFAIFGVDSRSNQLGKGTRSDSIMVVRVDHDAKTVRILSVFRDTMMNIEGHGYQKVTHAHAFGGPELAVDTLNKNLDLDIKHYVTLNFNSVGDIVDEIGGISQDLDASEVNVINEYIDEINGVRGTKSEHITEPGTYTLDGTQTVAYTRIRYTTGGDYKRTERQRTVLFKVFEAAKKLDTAEKVKFISDMIGSINTDYDANDALTIFKNLSEYNISDTTAYPQVFYGGKVDGAWVEVPCTLADMAKGVHQFLYGEAGYTPSDAVNEYSNALSEKVSEPNNDFTNTDFED